MGDLVPGIEYVILFVAGCVAGILNVIAGGGSFLTLPLLIFLGLPAVVANGTNRVGIVLQNIGAVWGFHRHGIVEWPSLLWAAVPATFGSVLGSWAALMVGDQEFKKILALLMVAVTLWTLWDPLSKQNRHQQPSGTFRNFALGLGFFLVGIYGGFVQAGVGFLILAVTTLVGVDLVRGNAIKVLSVLVFTAVSLFIFAWDGKVHWPMGLALAAGTVLGGLVGVRLAVRKGHAWVRGFVTATVLLFAVKLWLDS